MKRSRKGFTLVEILVCVAIILALAAISGSVYIRAKERAYVDVEISQMHQIGLAANLYHEQCEDWPMSSKQLVNQGLIPKDVCFSPRDRYPGGFTNAWLAGLGRNPSSSWALGARSNFLNTYFCVGDYTRGTKSEYEQYLTESSFGLFISNLDSKLIAEGFPITGIYEGPYRRVLLDGSVVVRQHREFTGKDHEGKPVKFGGEITWFFDPTQKWIDDIASSL